MALNPSNNCNLEQLALKGLSRHGIERAATTGKNSDKKSSLFKDIQRVPVVAISANVLDFRIVNFCNSPPEDIESAPSVNGSRVVLTNTVHIHVTVLILTAFPHEKIGLRVNRSTGRHGLKEEDGYDHTRKGYE